MRTALNTYRNKVLFDVTGLINNARDAKQLAIIEYAILTAKADMESESNNDIPDKLFARLMHRSEEQIEKGEFVSQDEMEKLVASW